MAVATNVSRLLARYSEGYRLAVEHGLSSSIVAEYAYRNQPRGHGPLGRFLDRRFLHQGAWDGVRRRFAATKEAVREEIQRRRGLAQRTAILDIASGTACYLREILREDGGADLEVYCRERDARQVMLARELAARESLAIDFFVGDASDEASYLCRHDPDIVIASGVLPALRRDDVARNVLRLIFRHLNRGGCLIATTICHPQARLSPWEARIPGGPAVRSSDKVESWLRATGFTEVRARPYSRDAVAVIAYKPNDPWA